MRTGVNTGGRKNIDAHPAGAPICVDDGKGGVGVPKEPSCRAEGDEGDGDVENDTRNLGEREQVGVCEAEQVQRAAPRPSGAHRGGEGRRERGRG